MRHPPVVQPEEMPRETIQRIVGADFEKNEDYASILALLASYYRQGDRRWNDYRLKWPHGLLALWQQIAIETRRNGFLPMGADEQRGIEWAQVISSGSGQQGDLCSMCDRKECKYRNELNDGTAKRIWQLNHDRPGWTPRKPCWQNKPKGETGHAEQRRKRAFENIDRAA